MKINKKNLHHWLWLGQFTLITLTAILLRPFAHLVNSSNLVLLYGHKLNGNLKGLYITWNQATEKKMELAFLTMDPMYYKQLKEQGTPVLLATKLSTVWKLAITNTIVSDHGLHCLVFLLKATSIRFIDVWHGIPFKGFDGDDFRIQHQYDEVWVTSQTIKNLYIEKLGFDESRLKPIGYARSDTLINQSSDNEYVKKKIGIVDREKKLILFAPTWKQDQEDRNILPFNVSEYVFFNELEKLCEETSSVVVIRTHLNSQFSLPKEFRHIYFAPSSQFPDTEAILLASDILVCDWSSIAFDYMLLNRPTIFLDVPAPFKKGFFLDANFRFGELVNDTCSMHTAIKEYLKDPQRYRDDHGKKIRSVTQTVYSSFADGKVGERYLKRLLRAH